ncbi:MULTISPECIES: YybH family protein [unclassified Brevibacterium]|uniref:YybH family protein n=1 Tax=unclassified Brevibacterium TaxID=2614124 RepID=UPI00196AB679|nr:SgcJ/EcaC family oxidoreductase [Brevibacterium sp. S111]
MLKTPEDVVTGWEDAWNRADADDLADLFAEDAEFVNVVGLWWHDRANIRDAHAFGFAHIFPNSRISMDEPRTRLVGTDAAVVQAGWHLTGQVTPAGEPAGDRRGVFTFVLERSKDGWIAVTAQNTDIEPSAQTHINLPEGRSAIHYKKRTSD